MGGGGGRRRGEAAVVEEVQPPAEIKRLSQVRLTAPPLVPATGRPLGTRETQRIHTNPHHTLLTKNNRHSAGIRTGQGKIVGQRLRELGRVQASHPINLIASEARRRRRRG